MRTIQSYLTSTLDSTLGVRSSTPSNQKSRLKHSSRRVGGSAGAVLSVPARMPPAQSRSLHRRVVQRHR
jgi:hypothetical protein